MNIKQARKWSAWASVICCNQSRRVSRWHLTVTFLTTHLSKTKPTLRLLFTSSVKVCHSGESECGINSMGLESLTWEKMRSYQSISCCTDVWEWECHPPSPLPPHTHTPTWSASSHVHRKGQVTRDAKRTRINAQQLSAEGMWRWVTACMLLHNEQIWPLNLKLLCRLWSPSCPQVG